MRRFLPRIFALLSVLLLASCYAGPPVASVTGSAGWFSLPFDELLHEGDARPVAMSLCAAAPCPKRLVVGEIAVTGASAAQLEALLHQPARLAAELKRREMNPTLKRAAKASSKQHIETVTHVAALMGSPADGLTLSMRRKDGKGHIEAAILGWREGSELHVLIAIGEDADAVREVAIRAVAQQMKAAGGHENLASG